MNKQKAERGMANEQIAGGAYKNFDYYVFNLRTHYVARHDMRKEDDGKCQK